ncbi:ParB/RepB/Spo0J family partition protein [bacterium]|nr:ParB/RepB/Spo0J family partition protein [bacterium]
MTKKSFKGKLDKIKVADKPESPLKIEKEGISILPDAKLIRIDLITENPNQPRKKFHGKKLIELADSIKERGILQPIRVRKIGNGFQIVAGERRFRAAQIAELKNIPAIVCNQSDEEAYTDALVENIQREDLNAMDRAEALTQLKVNLGSPSWEEVGKKVGISKRHVMNLLGLKALPENIREEIRNDKITEKHGRALRTLLGKSNAFEELHQRIIDDGLSGDQTLALARSLKSKDKEERFKKEFSSITKHRDEILSILSIMDFEKLTDDDKEKLKVCFTAFNQKTSFIMDKEEEGK